MRIKSLTPVIISSNADDIINLCKEHFGFEIIKKRKSPFGKGDFDFVYTLQNPDGVCADIEYPEKTERTGLGLKVNVDNFDEVLGFFLEHGYTVASDLIPAEPENPPNQVLLAKMGEVMILLCQE